jgi:hypothetical protein
MYVLHTLIVTLIDTFPSWLLMYVLLMYVLLMYVLHTLISTSHSSLLMDVLHPLIYSLLRDVLLTLIYRLLMYVSHTYPSQ